jgi:hypothetical protein
MQAVGAKSGAVLTTEEIRYARPLATVLPQDALTHAMVIAATLCASTEDAWQVYMQMLRKPLYPQNS